jgi:hypothetical protein
MEDEWDEHTYEDIVPLEIKLALEDVVFGWSHLASTFIGYTLFTVSAFLLTFAGLWHFTQSPVGHWIRAPLSLVAAWTTFRMVRRRRKVWFRSATVPRLIENRTTTKNKVQKADKSSWFGRMKATTTTQPPGNLKAETSY